MKAILGNFKKISETEFHLKRTLQFAQVALDETGKIKSVRYQDSENIDIKDILNHESIDYEIKNINADDFDKLVVTVERIDQPEQDVPDKSNFVPRKMTPKLPKTDEVVVPIPQKPNITDKHTAIIEEKIKKSPPVEFKPPKDSIKATPTTHMPKKKGIFKKFAGWISSNLSSYSNS